MNKRYIGYMVIGLLVLPFFGLAQVADDSAPTATATPAPIFTPVPSPTATANPVQPPDADVVPPPVPPVRGSQTSAEPVIPPIRGSGTSATAITSNSNTGSGSNTSSGSGSSIGNVGSGGGGYVNPNAIAVSVPVPISNSQCLSASFLTRGSDNDGREVTKLQTFLKNKEGLDVDVNGIFDAKTEAAVSAFQLKYSDAILAPWGATKPSGKVYITTIKKINQLLCNQAMTLTAAELAVIKSYPGNSNAGAGTQDYNGIGGEDTGSSIAVGSSSNSSSLSSTTGSDVSTDTATTTSIFGDESDSNSNVASLGSLSLWARFWDFITHLFY